MLAVPDKILDAQARARKRLLVGIDLTIFAADQAMPTYETH
jgi:hypothetical protein